MCSATGEEQQRDINDIFADLLLSEEHLNKDGYQEGLLKGISEGNAEAFHLGYHRGAEIGAELGYYLGVTDTLLADLNEENCNPRIKKNVKHLEMLRNMIAVFPNHNSEDVDILSLLDDIRTLFKRMCALLKLDVSYPEINKLSF